MDFWDRVKNSITGGIEAVKEKTSSVTDKTEGTARVLMSKRQMSELEKERDKIFTELGGKYYSLFGRGKKEIFSNSEVLNLLERAKEKDRKIAELRKEIEDVNREAELRNKERQKQKREEGIKELETKLGEHEAKVSEYKEKLEKLKGDSD